MKSLFAFCKRVFSVARARSQSRSQQTLALVLWRHRTCHRSQSLMTPRRSSSATCQTSPRTSSVLCILTDPRLHRYCAFHRGALLFGLFYHMDSLKCTHAFLPTTTASPPGFPNTSLTGRGIELPLPRAYVSSSYTHGHPQVPRLESIHRHIARLMMVQNIYLLCSVG